jgi:hypothetical protein
MPPLWQYFSRVWKKKAAEPIAAPKGSESRTPQTFSLQTGRFLGATTGATMAIADPSGPHPLRG